MLFCIPGDQSIITTALHNQRKKSIRKKDKNASILQVQVYMNRGIVGPCRAPRTSNLGKCRAYTAIQSMSNAQDFAWEVQQYNIIKHMI